MMHTTPKAPAAALQPSHGTAWTWRLHVLRSGDERQLGRVLHLRDTEHAWLLGRAQGGEEPGLRFSDGLMSREHLRLLVHGGAAATIGVEDLASTNGTFCDGVALVAGEAASGAALRFGDTVAVLEADAGRAPAFDAPSPSVPGRSELARLLRCELAAAAGAGLPTLIVGETGVGKEYAATELHVRSGRAGPLVRVNIAALPESLFESELFGAQAGAFTGAQRSRRGRIVEADGGTLVLDEIGELPPALQAKLLRVLEEGALRPLGGGADVHVDVHFVSSTNADLEALCEAGRFRPDLYARLSGRVVRVPPLRERRADLLDLADVVAPRRAAPGAHALRWCQLLPAAVTEALLLRPWRFNLRELRAVLTDLSALLDDPAAVTRWLATVARAAPPWPGGSPPSARSASPPPGPAAGSTPGAGLGGRWPARRRRAPPVEALRELLRANAGNVEAMARALGCARRQVYRWLEAAEIGADELEAARRESP